MPDFEITKETTMGDMLQYDMGIAYVLMQSGMHCVGCPSSIGESLEDACAVHGLDADEVLASIREYLAGRASAERPAFCSDTADRHSAANLAVRVSWPSGRESRESQAI